MPFPLLPFLAIGAVVGLVAVAAKKSTAPTHPGGPLALTPGGTPGTWEILPATVPIYTAPGSFTAMGDRESAAMVEIGSYVLAALHRVGTAFPNYATPYPDPNSFTAAFRVTTIQPSALGPIYTAQYIRKFPAPQGAADPFPTAPTPPDFAMFTFGDPQIRDATPAM